MNKFLFWLGFPIRVLLAIPATVVFLFAALVMGLARDTETVHRMIWDIEDIWKWAVIR